MRTEEQLRMVAEFVSREIANLRKLESMEGHIKGLDDINVWSCWVNGRDTATDLGITVENGFSDAEIDRAVCRAAIGTAGLYEII
jgi:hypothetical protein